MFIILDNKCPQWDLTICLFIVQQNQILNLKFNQNLIRPFPEIKMRD